jgi:hypothetical protein
MKPPCSLRREREAMREAMREAEAEAQQEKRKKKEKRKSTNTRNTSESWKGPNERKGKRERAWARKIIYKSKASPGDDEDNGFGSTVRYAPGVTKVRYRPP